MTVILNFLGMNSRNTKTQYLDTCYTARDKDYPYIKCHVSTYPLFGP